MYSAGQMGTSFYPDINETYRLIREGNFMPPDYFKTEKEDEVKLNMEYKPAFVYSEFGCIVDYLIKTYGKEKFIKYMKTLLDEDDDKLVFKRIYNKSFDEVIEEFRKQINFSLSKEE